tara:strand:- start:631 stop:885 length:255 start_codon:yes stop_codon:yes gene_type:complete
MNSKWSEKTQFLLIELHKELCISHKDWHKNKSDPDKRAAQLLTSALTQLINNGKINEIEELLIQSIKWLKKEVKDPGCPKKIKS